MTAQYYISDGLTTGHAPLSIYRPEVRHMRRQNKRKAVVGRLLRVVACLTFLNVGCYKGPELPIPTTPASQPPQPFSFAASFTQVSVGEVVRRQVTTVSDVPECTEERGWKCQYFRITVPTDGTLKIEMSYSPGTTGQAIDLSLADSEGKKSWHPVTAAVKGNTTYEIAIWYLTPGAQFEFRTSM
jgi:hypothetical protein